MSDDAPLEPLRGLDAEQEALLHRYAHDVRNLLTSTVGYLELLRELSAEGAPPPADTGRYLEVAEERAREALAMIDRLAGG